MIAKIICEDKREFYSYVFAKFNPGWNETVIVYDDEKEKFQLLRVYEINPYITRKIFVINTDTSNWINKDLIKLSLKNKLKDCQGYDWIINNKDLIKMIKDGKDVDELYKNIAKEMNMSIDKSQWHYVKDIKDAEDLLNAAWGFHDAEIDSINYILQENYDDPSVVQVHFIGCWDAEIILEFSGDILIHFNVNDTNSLEIMASNILFDNGFIYWVGEYVESINEIEDEYTYFRARSLKWKIITKS